MACVHPPMDDAESLQMDLLDKGDEWGFLDWGEPQEAVLKEPPLDQCLRQDLEILHSFEVLELKELLSKQTLFNTGINQVGPEDYKGGFELAEDIISKDFSKKKGGASRRIVRVQHDLGFSAPKEGQGSLVEYLFNKAILSLPTPDVLDLFPKDEPTEVVGIFETAPARLKLEVSTLEDYDLLTRYLNGFMEELLTKMTRHKMDVEMLKITKDKILKEAREDFTRADATEGRAEDVEIVLKKSAEENSRLLGIREALAVEVEELKAKVEAFEAKA
ncbi:hypothetical protein COCNU_14G008580 [Cocos nucifera]|uniref:Uncharacterized protein n=1 Tax=Cocos nucifera TaxID=13894 RepID=A0A8K0IVR3_COCNU|nr:hypothetical protein COCNU_14G008580 [Cocos nucifera]